MEKYKYHLRPGYGSKNLLIEVFYGAEHEPFLTDIFKALDSIHPVVHHLSDLWMNDEILMDITSDAGPFTLSKDIWGLAFLLADENQSGIQEIDAILQRNDQFQKVEVDDELYRLKGD